MYGFPSLPHANVMVIVSVYLPSVPFSNALFAISIAVPSVTYSASGESSVKTVASAGIDSDNFANLGINQTDDILLTITVKLDYASGGETYAKLYNYLLGGGAFVMDATVRLSEGGEA